MLLIWERLLEATAAYVALADYSTLVRLALRQSPLTFFRVSDTLVQGGSV
jgi:hypothetical protein